MNFKVGDKVKRISGENNPSRGLFEGNTYIIVGVDTDESGTWLALEGLGEFYADPHQWSAHNFELIKEEKYKITLKQGDACKIEGLTAEQYHQVAERFLGDGASNDLKFYSPHRHRHGWDDRFLEWHCGDLVHAYRPEHNTTIYTYEQIMEEDMSNFDIGDLKTGQRVTLGDGKQIIVYTNCCDCGGEILGYNKDRDSYSDLAYYIDTHGDIIKVEKPSNTVGFINYSKALTFPSYSVVWEKPIPLTPEQIKKQELQAKYDAAKKELEELGLALGVTK